MIFRKMIVYIIFVLGISCIPILSNAMFSGDKITVSINGQQTVATHFNFEGVGEKIYGAANNQWLQVSGQVKLKVDYDKSLGVFKKLEVTVNPVKDNKKDLMKPYVPDDPAQGKIPLAEEVEIKRWDQFMQKYGNLPVGQYIMTVQIDVDGSWDRQNIAFEVK